MIDLKLEEHLAPLGAIPRTYVIALIPLFLYMIYKVSLPFEDRIFFILTL